jgi:hypothetical protein
MSLTDNGYKGNRSIKKAGVKHEFSYEEFEEFVKCAEDPFYFITTYCKIIKPGPGLIQFEPYQYQRDVIDNMMDNRFTILKWPRQYGKTTTVGAILLWYVLFNKNYTIAVLAHQEKQSRDILGRIQTMFEHLPKWLQQGVSEWNKGSVEFENGSLIFTAATTPSAVRGRSIDWIYMDEFAFVPPNMQEEFYKSAFPTISSSDTTKMTISSTPNGFDFFWKIWDDCEKKKNDFVAHEVHWADMPGRDEAWKEKQIKNSSHEQFRQEYETEFLGSSNTLIDSRKLRILRTMNPISHSENVKVFKNPKKGRLYTLVVDTGAGGGGDYSAFVVLDVTEVPYEVVCTYRSKYISPFLYPNVIYEIAKRYNNAYLLIETQVGSQVAEILHWDLEYENIITTQTTRNGQVIGGAFGQGLKLGVHTSKAVKRIGCSNLKSLIESDKLLVTDVDIVFELSRFVSNSKLSFEAQEGHDDLVMCLVLFAWLTQQQYFRELCDVDVRKALLEQHESSIEEEISPFGIIDDGQVEEVEDVTLSVENWLGHDLY